MEQVNWLMVVRRPRFTFPIFSDLWDICRKSFVKKVATPRKGKHNSLSSRQGNLLPQPSCSLRFTALSANCGNCWKLDEKSIVLSEVTSSWIPLGPRYLENLLYISGLASLLLQETQTFWGLIYWIILIEFVLWRNVGKINRLL